MDAVGLTGFENERIATADHTNHRGSNTQVEGKSSSFFSQAVGRIAQAQPTQLIRRAVTAHRDHQESMSALQSQAKRLMKSAPPSQAMIESFIGTAFEADRWISRYTHGLNKQGKVGFQLSTQHWLSLEAMLSCAKTVAQVHTHLTRVCLSRGATKAPFVKAIGKLDQRLNDKSQRVYGYLAASMMVYLDEMSATGKAALLDATMQTPQKASPHTLQNWDMSFAEGEYWSLSKFRVALSESIALSKLLSKFEDLARHPSFNFSRFEKNMMDALGDCLGRLPPRSPARLRQEIDYRIQRAEDALIHIETLREGR